MQNDVSRPPENARTIGYLPPETMCDTACLFQMLSEPASQPALLVRADRRHENRVVAGQRADDLGHADVIERHGDAQRGADLPS